MLKSSLTSRQFVNIASLEEQARSILADARYVWQTEIWLDPIEKAKLAGEKLGPDQERAVARELLKASARMDDMLASLIDLYQAYDDAGAVTANYDATYKLVSGSKSHALGESWSEAERYVPKVIEERGFPADLFGSLMNAAKEVGVSFDGGELAVDREGVLILGEHAHRILRKAEDNFPRVDGNTLVREGLLQSYTFAHEDKGICTTDPYQALLAMAKYGSEAYRKRARQALKSGLVPRANGWDPVVVAVVVLVIAIIVAIIVGVLCATKVINNAQLCNIVLTVLGGLITILICYLAGKDSTFSCKLSSGGSDG
jgi:hypothetical protein